jgi:hypothetical protein
VKRDVFKVLFTFPPQDMIQCLRIAVSKEWVQYVKNEFNKRLRDSLPDDEHREQDVPVKEFLTFLNGSNESKTNVEKHPVRRFGLVTLYAKRITFRLFRDINAHLQEVDISDWSHDMLMDSFPGEGGGWCAGTLEKIARFQAASSSTRQTVTSGSGGKAEGTLTWLSRQGGVDGLGTLTRHGSFILRFCNMTTTDDEVPKSKAEWDRRIQYSSLLWPAFYRDENLNTDYLPAPDQPSYTTTAAWCKVLRDATKKMAVNKFLDDTSTRVPSLKGKVVVLEEYDPCHGPLFGVLRNGKMTSQFGVLSLTH